MAGPGGGEADGLLRGLRVVLKDIVPVATVAYAPVLLGVNGALPIKDFKEFLDYARRVGPPEMVPKAFL